MKKLAIGLAIASFPSNIAVAATAQPNAAPAVAAQPAPLVAVPVAAQPAAVLPANTQISLSMNETLTTKGKRWGEGDTFDLTVTHDVRMGNYIIIPRGSRGVGRITYLTNKGAFGKSGKMEIDLEYVEVHGEQIPVTGHYRQEGEGNTVGTVAGVVAVGVFAGFVTGHSGVIPQGRELNAYTKQDLPIAFAGPAPTSQPVMVAEAQNTPAAITAQPAPAPLQVAAPTSQATQEANVPKDLNDGHKAHGVRCTTCRP